MLLTVAENRKDKEGKGKLYLKDDFALVLKRLNKDYLFVSFKEGLALLYFGYLPSIEYNKPHSEYVEEDAGDGLAGITFDNDFENAVEEDWLLLRPNKSPDEVKSLLSSKETIRQYVQSHLKGAVVVGRDFSFDRGMYVSGFWFKQPFRGNKNIIENIPNLPINGLPKGEYKLY